MSGHLGTQPCPSLPGGGHRGFHREPLGSLRTGLTVWSRRPPHPGWRSGGPGTGHAFSLFKILSWSVFTPGGKEQLWRGSCLGPRRPAPGSRARRPQEAWPQVQN